jgi:hypothetical protein
LRATLVNLHPTLIIPPIPEKHTMADYAAKPTKAKEDAGIIELRKRMLAVFLNRCRKMQNVLDDGVYWRFLDPYTSWVRCSMSSTNHRADVPLERCVEQSACLQHPQADPQGAAAGHRKPHTSPQLPPSALVVCKAEVGRPNLELRHTSRASW